MRSVRPKISKCFSFNPGLGDLGWSFLRIIAALWSDSLGYICCLAFHKLFHPSWGMWHDVFVCDAAVFVLDKVLCLRWRLYFLVFWWRLGCHIVSGLGVIKWHFHPRFCVYFEMPAVCMFQFLDSKLTSNNPKRISNDSDVLFEWFWMCLPFNFVFSCFPSTQMFDKRIMLWGIDLQGGAWQARGPAAPLNASFRGRVRYVKCDASQDVLQCAGRCLQCTFIVHTGKYRKTQEKRENSKWTTVYHSQTFQTVFSAFFSLWSRCIFFACYGSYIEGQLHIGVSTFSSTLGRVSEAPYVKSLQVHVRARCFEMLVLQNPTFLQVLKISYIWPSVRDRILFSGSHRLARLVPRNMIEYHVRIFQLKVLSILQCCDYMSIWLP